MKRRWLRILLTGLVLLAIAGFGAFSTFLFNPFEGGYEYSLSTLIPREVDAYAAKSDLADDFDPFPVPAFFDELRESAGGEALLGLPAVTSLAEELQVERRLDEVREALAALPAGIRPLRVFGGRGAAFAGVLHGARLSDSDWAVYGFVNWLGKLGVELLRYPDLLGLADRGLTVEEEDGVLQLSGSRLPRSVYVTRILDVVVVATSRELATAARELYGVRGQNSFGLSAKYDDINSVERDDELEVFADYDALSEAMGWPKAWPDAFSESLPSAIAGKLFQAGFVRDVMGVIGFEKGLWARLTAKISSEDMNQVQKRLYRERGFDKARALEVAKLAPADAGLFAYVHGDVADMLREVLASLPEHMVSNIEDRVRAVWDHPDASYLIDDLATAFRDRAALVVRNDDYPDEGQTGPPPDPEGRVVATWALILWKDEASKVDELRDRIVARQDQLGIQGREPGERGVFINELQDSGYKIYEYWSRFVPGTGHIATVDLVDYFIISNEQQMLGQMVKTYFDGGPTYPRLADDPTFLTLVNTGLASSNLLVWWNPRAIHDTVRAIADAEAESSVYLDERATRQRVEREVLAEKFPGVQPGAIPEELVPQVQLMVDERVADATEELLAREVPALRQRWHRFIRASELVSGSFLEIAADQKELKLFGQAVVPLDGGVEGAAP